MPKLILIALLMLLISLYLIVVTDLYLLSPVKKEGVMTNLQSLHRSPVTLATRKVVITLQSGEIVMVAADTSIVFNKAVPITVYYTPVLHRSVGVTFVQDETLQHIDTLYFSQSSGICVLLFFLSVTGVVSLLRWSQGKNKKDGFLYAIIVFFVFLLSFQYSR